MSTVFVGDGDFVMSSDDVDNKMVAWVSHAFCDGLDHITQNDP